MNIVTDDYNGPDRRVTSGFDLQVALAKLIAKVEATEQNIALKIESMESIHAATSKALESKVDSLLARLEAQVNAAASCADDAAEDAAEALRVTSDQDHKLVRFETTERGVISTLTEHDKSIKNLDRRVATLEHAPGTASLAVLKRVGSIGLGILVTGFIGLLWWVLRNPTALSK
jgi:mevalonate kinase